jgi:hypothetical protein
MATPSISKQERIRLNQQRSRARKQEYLQELEKRVLDCHSTCREADMQRESHQRLLEENTKLRALLASAGVEGGQIDACVANDGPDGLLSSSLSPPSTAAGAAAAKQASALRNIRPKLTSDATLMQTTTLMARPSEPFALSNGMPVVETASPQDTGPSSASSSCCKPIWPASSGPMDQGSINAALSSSAFSQSPQYCESFDVCHDTFQPLTTTESVNCVHARTMVDHYNTTGQSLQQISYRLAPGFSREISPGGGCQVNKQLLFQVLDEVSLGLG